MGNFFSSGSENDRMSSSSNLEGTLYVVNSKEHPKAMYQFALLTYEPGSYYVNAKDTLSDASLPRQCSFPVTQGIALRQEHSIEGHIALCWWDTRHNIKKQQYFVFVLPPSNESVRFVRMMTRNIKEDMYRRSDGKPNSITLIDRIGGEAMLPFHIDDLNPIRERGPSVYFSTGNELLSNSKTNERHSELQLAPQTLLSPSEKKKRMNKLLSKGFDEDTFEVSLLFDVKNNGRFVLQAKDVLIAITVEDDHHVFCVHSEGSDNVMLLERITENLVFEFRRDILSFIWICPVDGDELREAGWVVQFQNVEDFEVFRKSFRAVADNL